MKIAYRTQALSDLEEIFLYIHKRNPGGARNVIDAIHDAIAQIAEYPLGAERTPRRDIHVKIVRKYPYKIFYRAGADQVEILHVRHGARRPFGWVDRERRFCAERSRILTCDPHALMCNTCLR